MRRGSLVFLFVVLSGVLAACGGDGGRPPAARQPTPLDPATTGTIVAQVRVEGTVPPMQPLRMSGFAECAAAHPEPVLAGDLLVHDGHVENAFVYLKDGLGDRVFAVPSEPVVIDQQGCLYVPRVAGAQVGQPVEFRNSDSLLHNVHGTPREASGWNVSLPRKGAERTIRIDKPEVMISVRCDVHPWMQGWLGALDHPYFGVSAADGQVTLRNVPPGDYVLAVWHERLGTQETRVTVAPQGTAQAAFTLRPPS